MIFREAVGNVWSSCDSISPATSCHFTLLSLSLFLSPLSLHFNESISIQTMYSGLFIRCDTAEFYSQIIKY